MITSAWYNRSPNFLHWGVLTIAEFTWQRGRPEKKRT